MEFRTQGITLAVAGATSPFTYAAIQQITSISGFGTTRSEIDTTDLDDASRTFILGLKDNGSVQISLNYDPDNTQHTLLRTLNNDGTARNFRLTLSDTSPKTVYQFSAYVMEFALEINVDDVLKATATLRISGDIT